MRNKQQIISVLIFTCLVIFLNFYCYSNELTGRVVGNKESLIKMLEKAKTKQPTDEKDLIAVTKPSIVPIKNAIVILSNNSTKKQVATDDKGLFKFSNLDPGKYELTAYTGDTKSGQTNIYGFARRILKLDKTSDPSVELRLRPEFAIICGKVMNSQGKAIKGAKVTATYSNPSTHFQQHLETQPAPTFTTYTGVDGLYEFHGIPAANANDLMGFLVASKSPKSFITITAQNENGSFTTDKIPVITETQLNLAKNLLEIYHNLPNKNKKIESQIIYATKKFPAIQVTKMWGEMKEPIKFIPVPQSRGHVITGIDIVLD